MNKYGFSSYKEKQLHLNMKRLKIHEKDIREQFVSSPGKGGQNVNKLATCVHLYHVPTGLTVKCHKYRSQGFNRFAARQLLIKKVEHRLNQLERQKIHEHEKQRRKTRKRSKRAKESILTDKRYRSQQKETRQKINVQRLDKFL